VTLDVAKAVPIQNEIARRGGLNLKRIGTELVGACPKCGGTDRFAVLIPKQCFLCRGCDAAGDVIALVQHIDGCDFRNAIQILGEGERVNFAGSSKIDPRPIELVNQSAVDGQNTKWALQIWSDAAPIAGTPAETYLHRRGLRDLPGDSVLRFHARCAFGKARVPCLVAMYRDVATDEPRAISRTAIDSAGNKVGRMSLGPVGGAAIKIDDDIDVEQGLVVGEGLETVLAARQLGLRPAWALGSAGAIRNFPVLSGIDALTILVDHDAPDQRGRQAGQAAATECWHRWKGAGREVLAFSTDRLGTDIADVIEEARHG
jgi:hypothetical protein